MPLTMRSIPHALNLGAPEIYGQGTSGEGSRGTQVLEDVNMASMVGTLAQLGALATVSKKRNWVALYHHVRTGVMVIGIGYLSGPRRRI